MKKNLCLLVFLFLVSNSCFANVDRIETKQDAYFRQSNQNYNTYQQNHNQAPLGGYNQPLGSSTSGYQYGLQQQNNSNNNFYYNNNNNNNSRNRNGWNY